MDWYVLYVNEKRKQFFISHGKSNKEINGFIEKQSFRGSQRKQIRQNLKNRGYTETNLCNLLRKVS